MAIRAKVASGKLWVRASDGADHCLLLPPGASEKIDALDLPDEPYPMEGSDGDDDGTTLDPDAKLVAAVTKRWHDDAALRKLHGVSTSNQNDPLYKARLARLIKAEQKCRADQKAGAGRKVMNPAVDDGDSISRILSNRNVAYSS